MRLAEWNDAEAISQVNLRNGLGLLDPVVWREYWDAYPFADEFRDIPIGWVLEDSGGAVVGTLSNMHMLYDLGGKRLRGTIAALWAVDAVHRGKALRLMNAFFRQKGVDLLLNVSASPGTARILTGMKIPRIPIPDYGTPCLWALRPRPFARAALSRKAIPGAEALAWPAGLGLLVWDIIRRSGRGRLSLPVRRLEKFDDRFDSFWQRILSGQPRLRAVRNRAVLEWRFRVELRERRIAIIAAEPAGKLSGYAVLVRRAGSELGMEMYDVADIQAEGDDPAIFRDLLLGSMNIARDEKMDALKFLTGTPVKRRPAEQLQPYTYNLSFWQQYYQAATPQLATALSSADDWDLSLFDTF